MRIANWLGLTAVVLIAATLASCGGGGGGDEVRVTAINLNPATVTAGSIITLTASISAPGQSVSSLIKNWNVSAGTLTANAPDFSLLLRQTARGASAASVSTTSDAVYWVAPAEGGSATISVQVEQDTESINVTIGASPVTLSVTSGANGKKTCTISANNVTDLYQAAFRLSFAGGYRPAEATAGGFLGGANEILTLALTNQNGFVPMAITRKGNVAGVDGSGVLATITFDPVQAASSVSQTVLQPFALEIMDLRDSNDQPISYD